MLVPISPDVSPPGARWKYTDPANGQPFSEPSLKQLVIAVGKARAAMLELDTSSDIDLRPQWQERLIHEMCVQMQPLGLKCENHDENGRSTTVWMGLSDLVRRWNGTKANWEAAGRPFVSPEEAERRASICRSCPENRPITGCFGCGGFAAEVSAWMGGLKTLKDEHLHTCFVCGCFLRSKVWMPLDVIDNQGADFTPVRGWCWQAQPSPGASPTPSSLPETVAQ